MSAVFAIMMFCLAATVAFLGASVAQWVRDDWYGGSMIFKVTGVGMVAVSLVIAGCCLWLGVWMASGGP